MSGESDLVLGSLTPEELDDANRYLGLLIRSWRSQSKDEARRVGLDSDGPFHLLAAMRLALVAEMAQRGGAAPWYAGEPTDGHIAAGVLELYARRYQLRAQEARLSAAGIVRQCAICGDEKPQDHEHFDRPDGLWADICRACHRTDPERYREAIAFSPPPAPGAPPPSEADLVRML